MMLDTSVNSRYIVLTFQLLTGILLLSLTQQLQSTNIPESTQHLGLDCPVPRDKLCTGIEWRAKVLCNNNNNDDDDDDDDDTSILRLSCHNTQQQLQHHVILVQYINSSTSTEQQQQQQQHNNKNQLSHTSSAGKSCFSSAEIFRACHQRVSCHVTSSSELIGRPLCSHSILYACVSVKALRDLKSTANCSRHSVTSLCAAFNAKRDRRQVLVGDDVTPSTSRRRSRRKTTVTLASTTAADDVTTDDVAHDVMTQPASDDVDQSEPQIANSATTEATTKTTTTTTTTTSSSSFPFIINIVQNISTTATTATATIITSSSSSNNNRHHHEAGSDVAVEWFWTATFIKGHCQMLILYAVLGVAFGLICLLLFVIIRIGCCRTNRSVRYTRAVNNGSSIHRSSYSSPSTDKGIATPSTTSIQASPGGKRSGSPVWACDDDTGARLAKSGSPRGNGWTVGPESPRTDAEIDRVQFGVWGTAPGQSASLGRPYTNPYRHDSYRVDGMKTLQLR